MLDLLQETLQYIEEQNEWLIFLRTVIDEKELKYKMLYSKISQQISKEIDKEHVDGKNNFDYDINITNAKVEPCDVNNDDNENEMENIEEPTSMEMADYEQFAYVVSEDFHSVTNEENCQEDANGKLENIQSICRNITKSVSKSISVSNQQENDISTHQSGNIMQICADDSNTLLVSKAQKRVCSVVSLPHNTSRVICRRTAKPSNELPIMNCPYCEKTFGRKGNLERHVRSHTGEKPFQCTLCEMSFRQNSHLKSHIRCHTGEKPYKCLMCEKSFSQKGNLDRHVATHNKLVVY